MTSKKSISDIVCQASFTWKKIEFTLLIRFARLTGTVFLMSELSKICLLDSGQKSLTLTTKTAPEGLLRLILEEDPWNRLQSLHYNSPYRLRPFWRIFWTKFWRPKSGSLTNFQKSIWKIAWKLDAKFRKNDSANNRELRLGSPTSPGLFIGPCSFSISFVPVAAKRPQRENFSRNWKVKKRGCSVFCF